MIRNYLIIYAKWDLEANMTNKEKREYLNLSLAFTTKPFLSEIDKIKYFNSRRPKRLFKFRCFDDFTFDMLNNNYLYVPSVKQLDDPFDCLTNIDLNRMHDRYSWFKIFENSLDYMSSIISSHEDYDQVDKTKLIDLFKILLIDDNLDCNVIKNKVLTFDTLPKLQQRVLYYTIINFKRIMLSIIEDDDLEKLLHILSLSNTSIGVCSLTTKRDNKVMWSLYSNTYKGYCVEYEPITDINIIKCLKPVIYTKKSQL